MSIQYIYLLQTREFVNSGEQIYKVGKTKKMNYIRFRQYPNGSVLLFQCVCDDCDALEPKILKLFNSKYTNHKIAGREYFKGNVRLMISDLFQVIDNEMTTQIQVSSDINSKMSLLKNRFSCQACDFSTKTNFCLEVHYATKKHIRNTQPLIINDSNKHQCKTCNNGYKYASGLYAHIKKCKPIKIEK